MTLPDLPADLTLYDALHAITIFLYDELRNPTQRIPGVVDIGDGWRMDTLVVPVALAHRDVVLWFKSGDTSCNDRVLPDGVTRPDPHAVLHAFIGAVTPLRRVPPNTEAVLKVLRSL